MASPEAPSSTGLPGRKTLERYTVDMFGDRWVDRKVVGRVRGIQDKYTREINAAASPLPPDPRRTRVAEMLRGKVPDEPPPRTMLNKMFGCIGKTCKRMMVGKKGGRRRSKRTRRHRRSSRR